MWEYQWNMSKEVYDERVAKDPEDADNINNWDDFNDDFTKLYGQFTQAFFRPTLPAAVKEYEQGAVWAWHGWVYIGEHELRFATSEGRSSTISMSAMEEVSGFQVPMFFKVVAELKTGIMYAVGQEVTIALHNQKPTITTDDGESANAHAEITWTILEICGGEGKNKLSGKEEPMLLLYSEYSKYKKNKDTGAYEKVKEYPRWKYWPMSKVKMKVSKFMAPMTDKKLLKLQRLAAYGRKNDPEDPNPPSLEPVSKLKEDKSAKSGAAKADRKSKKVATSTKTKKAKVGGKRKEPETSRSSDHGESNAAVPSDDEPRAWKKQKAELESTIASLKEDLLQLQKQNAEATKQYSELLGLKSAVLNWAQTKLDGFNENNPQARRLVQHFIPTALHIYFPDLCK